MAYRSITIKVNGVDDECFRAIQKQLCLYDNFIVPNDSKKLILFSKDDKKSVYSIDAGCVTTELNAALSAIRYYLGEYQKHVEISVH